MDDGGMGRGEHREKTADAEIPRKEGTWETRGLNEEYCGCLKNRIRGECVLPPAREAATDTSSQGMWATVGTFVILLEIVESHVRV